MDHLRANCFGNISSLCSIMADGKMPKIARNAHKRGPLTKTRFNFLSHRLELPSLTLEKPATQPKGENVRWLLNFLPSRTYVKDSKKI